MKTTVPDPDDPAGGGYGLGLIAANTSCGVRLWGHSGGWLGSISNAVTTEDGRHSLAYNANGDWTADGMAQVTEAEFCGDGTPGKG